MDDLWQRTTTCRVARKTGVIEPSELSPALSLILVVMGNLSGLRFWHPRNSLLWPLIGCSAISVFAR